MKFIQFISENNLGRVEKNKSLKDITSFRIGGVCKYFILPNGIFELAKIVKYCNQLNIKFYVVGNCTNVLISDDYFDMAFISLQNINNVKCINNIYMLDSGLKSMPIGYDLIKKGYEEALPLALIPGTIGGIIYMNGSCFKRDITKVLTKIVMITNKGNIIVRKAPFKLNYRNTCFQTNNCIIARAVFEFAIQNSAAIQLYKKYLNIKKETQPLNTHNAGSIFKNPIHDSAWSLIDKAGLRGFHIGDAEVSSKHCNFLINKGHATFLEMMALIYYVKYRVFNLTGILLETEVKILTPYSI